MTRLFHAVSVLLWLLLAPQAGAALLRSSASDLSFPTMKSGETTYTNVIVMSAAAGTITFQHASGLASVPVDSLAPAVQKVLERRYGAAATVPKPLEESAALATNTTTALSTNAAAAGKEPRDPFSLGALQVKVKDTWNNKGGAGTYLIFGALALGTALLGVGAVWMVLAAFHESAMWGICCILFWGLAHFFFVMLHWEKAEKPFLCMMGGGILCGVATGLIWRG
jgi:hypothetical protein